jgi:hypothetical protein
MSDMNDACIADSFPGFGERLDVLTEGAWR